MAIGPSTKLNAVNDVLRGVGVGTVTVLAGSVDATVVEDMIDRSTDLLLERGWYFNTEDRYYPIPSAADWIHFGPDILRGDPQNKSRRAVERGFGRRLYDLRNNQFEWTNGPTNLLSDPFDYDQSSWTKSDLTVATHQGTDPLGSNIADEINQTGTSNIGFIFQDVLSANITDGDLYEFGLYAAPVGTTGGNFFRFSLDHTGGSNIGRVKVDLTTGLLTSVEGHARGVQVLPVEHGVYYLRAQMVLNFALYGGTAARFQLEPSDLASDEDATYVWGAHLKKADKSAERLRVVQSFTQNPQDTDILDAEGAFASIPPTARSLVTAEVLYLFALKVIGDSPFVARLQQKAFEAEVELKRADDEYCDANMLTDNVSVASILGSGARRSPLVGGGGHIGGHIGGMSTE